MKAILKLKNKKIYLDWEFGYSKIPYYFTNKLIARSYKGINSFIVKN